MLAHLVVLDMSTMKRHLFKVLCQESVAGTQKMMPEIKPTLPGQAKLVTFEEDVSSDSYDLSSTGSAFTVAEEALERIGTTFLSVKPNEKWI